ncbi:hypothetical protein QLX67_13840, partial [Balneolaceae bacterium ANBcel3]|nr:hypothetical protein [Balneolaceae bacterium ANBcel3]
NRDAVGQDLLAAATAAQGIWQRPEALGGAGRDFTATPGPGAAAANLAPLLNIPAPPGGVVGAVITNENGTYEVLAPEAARLDIDVEPASWNYEMELRVCRYTDPDTDRAGWNYGIDYGDGTGTPRGSVDCD